MQLSAVLLSVKGALTDGGKARPGAAELIAALDARGVASAALADGPAAPARALLERLDVIPNALVGADDAARPRPAPDMLFRACEVLGVPPWEALVIGASETDRRAADAAGCLFVGVNAPGAFTIGALADALPILDGAGLSR